MPEQPSITCPVCGMTSYNLNDIRYGYCGNCHEFTGTPLVYRVLRELGVESDGEAT